MLILLVRRINQKRDEENTMSFDDFVRERLESTFHVLLDESKKETKSQSRNVYLANFFVSDVWLKCKIVHIMSHICGKNADTRTCHIVNYMTQW